MSARAKLHRIAVQRLGLSADLDDTDGLAILVSKNLHDVAAIPDFGIRHLRPGDRNVFQDLFVDQFLDIADLRALSAADG